MQKISVLKNLMRHRAVRFLYQNFFKPLAFSQDPETTHNRILHLGNILGRGQLGKSLTTIFLNFQHPSLRQIVFGKEFRNPIGLGGGFDKNAVLTGILPSVGFGFMEVGSITGQYCAGNPRPRLWRLKNDKALAVNYGLPSDGCLVVKERLEGRKFTIPLGLNIAPTNSSKINSINDGIRDYLESYKCLQNIGNYWTINISCPNAMGGQPFAEPENLAQLLDKLTAFPKHKPILLKLPPDLPLMTVDRIIILAQKYQIDGFIASNLTKNRVGLTIAEINPPLMGGLSGKLVKARANQLISYLYQKTKGKMVIVGLGGVFSATDAYEKIKLGATLVQLVTGMIFEGPQLIGEINYGLAQLLRQDGYRSISEATGAAHRNES